ncbi:MAG: tetratricopeptide repeat protein [Gammaproteobacteria bacterium]|nr:tetratricopeptide repeat protein [Gammaproteobacteria bacterium]
MSGNKFSEREKQLLRSLTQNKKDSGSILELARIYLRSGRAEHALHLLSGLDEQQGIALRSLALAHCGRNTEAIALAGRSADPDEDPHLLHLLAYWLNQQGCAAQALGIFQAALTGAGNHAGIRHDYAIALHHTGNLQEALAQYQAAFGMDSDNPHLAFNLALALEQSDQLDEALQQIGRVLTIAPDHLGALYRRSYLQRLLCIWKDYPHNLAALSAAMERHIEKPGAEMISPYGLNIHFPDSELHDRAAACYARQISGQAVKQRSQLPVRPIKESGSLNIAYLSPDFSSHAVGSLISGLFACHDRQKFKVFAYSLVRSSDEIQRDIEAGVDTYRDVSLLSPAQIAGQIADDDIDILIDLAGYTRNARPQILAMRPARLQVSFLGYLNTMQAPFVDALIADDEVIPMGEESAYSEQVMRLPCCFLPVTPREVDSSSSRVELGLPEDAFVFCSFNHSYKLQPEIFSLWMEILQKTDGSVLWLLADRETVRNNLLAVAEEAGIADHRLIFADRVPLTDHLARMKAADLFLDTPDYNGGATIVAAAQSGLPTLTLRGNRILGRMGASLNKTLGLEELICDTQEEYLERANRFAKDPGALSAIRERLAMAVTNNLSIKEYCKEMEGLLIKHYRQISDVRRKESD